MDTWKHAQCHQALGKCSPKPQHYYLTAVRKAVSNMITDNWYWQGCGEKGPSCTVGGDYKLMTLLWKTVGKFLKELNDRTPYEPIIALLAIYQKGKKKNTSLTSLSMLGNHFSLYLIFLLSLSPMFLCITWVIVCCHTWVLGHIFFFLLLCARTFLLNVTHYISKTVGTVWGLGWCYSFSWRK